MPCPIRQASQIKKGIVYDGTEFTLPLQPKNQWLQVERDDGGTIFRYVVSHDGSGWWNSDNPFIWRIGDRWKYWSF